MPGDSNASEHHFAHLLKPIRDLAKNWNIDVASDLEEYLVQLEDIQISFDGGNTSLNFAEAALIIQGSACVYSRKVEFLYNLIYQCLEIVVQKSRHARQKSSVNSKGVDEDAVVQAEAEFLTLDDHLEAAKHIDLDESQAGSYKELRQGSLMVRTPLSVLNTRPAERKGASSRHDFKISECVVHPSGALLFEDRDSRLVDLSLHRQSFAAGSLPFGSPATLLDQSAAAPQQINAGQAGDSAPPADVKADAVAQELDFAAGAPDADAFSDGEPDDVPGDGKHDVDDTAAADDPWAMMDPHAECQGVRARPFRYGKTSRLPRRNKHRDQLVSRSNGLLEFERDDPELDLTSFAQPSLSMFGSIYVSELKRRHKASAKARRGRLARAERGVPVAGTTSGDAFDDECSSSDEFDVAAGAGAADDLVDGMPVDDDFALPDAVGGAEVGVFGGEAADAQDTFEDMCRKHVEMYADAARKYMAETNLSRRVSAWQDRIQPILNDMDARPEYDIHEYGTRIVDSIQEAEPSAKELEFGDVVAGKEKFEVCRVFLASLQLANNRSVDISPIKANGTQSLRLAVLDQGKGSAPQPRAVVEFAPVDASPAPRKAKRVKVTVEKQSSSDAVGKGVDAGPRKGKTRLRRSTRRGLRTRSTNVVH